MSGENVCKKYEVCYHYFTLRDDLVFNKFDFVVVHLYLQVTYVVNLAAINNRSRVLSPALRCANRQITAIISWSRVLQSQRKLTIVAYVHYTITKVCTIYFKPIKLK